MKVRTNNYLLNLKKNRVIIPKIKTRNTHRNPKKSKFMKRGKI